MTSVARAAYRLQVAWNAYNVGLLTFDLSTFNGADVFGNSPLDVSFGGTYDDVSPYVRQADWSRGRNDNLDTMLAGQATFTIRDPGWTTGGVYHPGLFNPDNSSSPLYGQLEDRLHPVRWEAIDSGGTKRGLFAGWARKITFAAHGRRGYVQIECVDLFYWLNRVRPVIVGTGPTTTGAAIGLVLDAIGLTDAAMRDLDVGDSIPDFFADGSKSGTQIIGELLEAERGVFFAAGSGKATYRSRLSRLLKTSAFTLANRMIAAAPGIDFDQAKTRVSVTRVNGLGVPTWFSVSTSSTGTKLGKIGLSDLPEIQTYYLASNTQSDQLADWIRSQVESPRPPMYDLTIDNREADLLAQILTRELVDKITATEASGGTVGDYHIDNMAHSYRAGPDDGRHTAAYLLSRASTVTPAVFDSSTFDSGAVFVY